MYRWFGGFFDVIVVILEIIKVNVESWNVDLIKKVVSYYYVIVNFDFVVVLIVCWVVKWY